MIGSKPIPWRKTGCKRCIAGCSSKLSIVRHARVRSVLRAPSAMQPNRQHSPSKLPPTATASTAMHITIPHRPSHTGQMRVSAPQRCPPRCGCACARACRRACARHDVCWMRTCYAPDANAACSSTMRAATCCSDGRLAGSRASTHSTSDTSCGAWPRRARSASASRRWSPCPNATR